MLSLKAKLCCLLSVVALTGCFGSKISKSYNSIDYETTFASNLGQTSRLKGHERVAFDLIKYKSNDLHKDEIYKIRLRAAKGEKPGFKKGDTLELKLNKHEYLVLNSKDGEATGYYDKGVAIKDVYYEVNEDALDKIIRAKKIEFRAEAKAYKVGGKLSRSDIKTLKKVIEE